MFRLNREDQGEHDAEYISWLQERCDDFEAEVQELRAWKEGKKGVEDYFRVVEELRQANLEIIDLKATIGNYRYNADRASKWSQE